LSLSDNAMCNSQVLRCPANDELIKRDKASLDIFWLKDESLEDSANLPDPDVIAAEIVDDPVSIISMPFTHWPSRNTC
jgi:type I restriction enzyme M protein